MVAGQFVHTEDECIPSVSLRCSQDSRSFHQRIEISEILTEPQSLCSDWLMKADKSDEKIPTQTICTLGAIFNIYIQLFQLSFASTQKYAKYFCTDLRRSRWWPMSFVWVCDIHCPDVIVIPALRGRRVTLIRNDADIALSLSLCSVQTRRQSDIRHDSPYVFCEDVL